MSHGFSKQGIVVVALVACTLAACGGGGGGAGDGGGGGGGGPPPPPTFTVGGSISGLVGSLTLQNTGGAQLTVSANGSFTFAGTVAAGSTYDVAVATQPGLQTCTVANGSGTASANVTNIAISCADTTQPLTLTLSVQAIKTFRFAWTAVPGITRYKLMEDATGNSGFTQAGADIAASATSIDHIVPLYRRVNARYIVQACAATRCIDSNTVSASGSLAEAVGYFKASSITVGDSFGGSVALSADGATLAVGVSGEDSNATGVNGNLDNDLAEDSGAVYVFVRDGAGLGSGTEHTWARQAYIKASNARPRDTFGQALALDSSGATLAVGAGRNFDPGAVYVFERSDGVWTEQATLEASNDDGLRFGDNFFGNALTLSGDGRTLAVGASFEDSNATGVGGDPNNDDAPLSGAVYVFVREAQGFAWRQDAYVKASNTDEFDNFGASVALSADGATLAVGAVGEDSGAAGVDRNQGDNSVQESGAVYVFTHAGQWTQQAYIKASNTDDNDQFGVSLALSADGSTLAVGAHQEDSAATGVNGNQGDGTASDAGAAYVFVRLNETWTQQAYIKASNTAVGPNNGDLFGTSLALSADGSILAVGAPNEDSGAIGIGGDDSDSPAGRDAGAVYVFERSDDSWAQRAYVKPSNTAPQYGFGAPVALSGDGATLAVGATSEHRGDPGINGDQNSGLIARSGAVYLY